MWLWIGLASVSAVGVFAMLFGDGGAGSGSRGPSLDQQALLAQIAQNQSQMRKLEARVGELELQVDTLKRTSSYEALDGTRLPSVPDPLDTPGDGLPPASLP